MARKSNKPHKIVMTFETKEEMLSFADSVLADEVAVYHADMMDREFTGAVPANSYVIRRRGAKPDGFLAERDRIGADEEVEEEVYSPYGPAFKS